MKTILTLAFVIAWLLLAITSPYPNPDALVENEACGYLRTC